MKSSILVAVATLAAVCLSACDQSTNSGNPPTSSSPLVGTWVAPAQTTPFSSTVQFRIFKADGSGMMLDSGNLAVQDVSNAMILSRINYTWTATSNSLTSKYTSCESSLDSAKTWNASTDCFLAGKSFTESFTISHDSLKINEVDTVLVYKRRS